MRDRFADGVAYVELAPLLRPRRGAAGDRRRRGAAPAAGGDPVAGVAAERLRDQQLLLVLDNVEHLLEAAPQIAAADRGRARADGARHQPGPAAGPRRDRGGGRAARACPTAVHGRGRRPGRTPAARARRRRQPGLGDRSGGRRRGRGDLRPAGRASRSRSSWRPPAARLLDPAGLLDRLDAALLDGAAGPARSGSARCAPRSTGATAADARRSRRCCGCSRSSSAGSGSTTSSGVAGAARARADDVLTVLEALAEQSLVRAERGRRAGRRHRLLEPVAQYARARLDEAGEWEPCRRAHAEHFLALAEETGAPLPRRRPGRRAGAGRRGAPQPDGRDRAQPRPPGRRAAGRLLLGAVDVLVAARPPRPRTPPVRGRAGATTCPPTCARGRELAAATMGFAMDDVARPRATGWRPSAHAGGRRRRRWPTRSRASASPQLADGRPRQRRRAASSARDGPIAERGGADGEWTCALSLIWLGTVSLLPATRTSGRGDRAGAGVGPAPRRPADDVHRALQPLPGRAGPRPAREAREHLEEGMRLSRETGDHANLAYLLDAAPCSRPADGPMPGCRCCSARPGDPRDDRRRTGTATTGPDPQAIAGAADEARAHLGADRYDDALDVGRGDAARARPRRSRSASDPRRG